MFKWLENTYYWLLFYTGFADTDGKLKTPDDREKVTFMLRRMKERLGIIWWILSLGMITLVPFLCVYHSWWWAILGTFQLWLFAHVLYPYTPKNNIWKG